MELPNGRYHLKSDPNPPGMPDMRVSVGESGMATNFGVATYDDGAYAVPLAKVMIEVASLPSPPNPGRYKATVGGPPPAPVLEYTGDIIPLP